MNESVNGAAETHDLAWDLHNQTHRVRGHESDAQLRIQIHYISLGHYEYVYDSWRRWFYTYVVHWPTRSRHCENMNINQIERKFVNTYYTSYLTQLQKSVCEISWYTEKTHFTRTQNKNLNFNFNIYIYYHFSYNNYNYNIFFYMKNYNNYNFGNEKW